MNMSDETPFQTFMEEVVNNIPSITLDELAVLVAISTFLVGFEANRLQSVLAEWKEFVARGVDRVLQQNNADSLLPLPAEITEMNLNYNFAPRGRWTSPSVWTNILLALMFVFSCLFFVRPDNRRDLGLLFLQALHLFIVLMGWVLNKDAEKLADEYLEKQPYRCFEDFKEKMRNYIVAWEEHHESVRSFKQEPVGAKFKAKNRSLIASMSESEEKLDNSLPKWCWLQLVQFSCRVLEEGTWVEFSEEGDAQLSRIRRVSSESMNHDEYSCLAFVWSSYLLQKIFTTEPPRKEDLERVKKLGKHEIFAELAMVVQEQSVKHRNARSNLPNSAV